MTRHAKTQRIIDEAYAILADYHPMTVRQCYYQLISRHAVEIKPGQKPKTVYDGVSDALVAARREGLIPWEWIEDRLRKVRNAGDGWDGVEEYWDAQMRYLVSGYWRATWPSQPRYVEVWLEKDALSSIFEEALAPYNVPLNVGRGYDSWSSIHEAALRYQAMEERGKPTTILHFGDFDPSGVDMPRSLRDRLADFDCYPTLTTVSLTWDEVQEGRLPASIEPISTKPGDTRGAAYVAKYGDIAVELDALPPVDLQQRIVAAVESVLDLAALEMVRQLEADDREDLARRLMEVGA